MPFTLLLADDSVTVQRVIELTFADEDVRVEAVSDGDQAIASLDRRPPDIVLADAGMPGRDGYEVASYIKSQSHLAHIPVLLLTGAFQPIDQAKADRAGCDGVLAKPFEPKTVIQLVNELLAEARARSEPPAASAPGASPSRGTAPPLPPPIDDEWVERVACRVIEKLSDRIVRETLADVVSPIAERLVRAEIARINGANR